MSAHEHHTTAPEDRISLTQKSAYAVGMLVNNLQAAALPALLPWGVDFDQVAVARGDSNSAGRRGIASSVNELMNRAVARELGRSRSPCPLRPPYKGPGSVKARARIMSSACIEGRLYVHQDCQRLIHTFRHWMGGEKHKHPFDAAGYICEHWLSPVTRAGAPYTLVR